MMIHRRCSASWVLFGSALLLLSTSAAAHTVEREIVDEEGNRYVGDTLDGVIQGVGRFDWTDGSSYEGEVKNGEVHGEGTMHYVDGTTYTGTFNQAKRQGFGVLTMKNGDVYIGTFVSDQMTGEGEWTSEVTGESYNGLWKDGKRQGTGVLTREDGSQFSGSFLDNQKHGFGELIEADGKIYRGYFRADQKHGDGILEINEQTKHFQSWHKGQLVVDEVIRNVENCQLVIQEVPWMFIGKDCVDGLAHGAGRAVALDGSAYVNHGKFVLGDLVQGVILPMTLPEEFHAP